MSDSLLVVADDVWDRLFLQMYVMWCVTTLFLISGSRASSPFFIGQRGSAGICRELDISTSWYIVCQPQATYYSGRRGENQAHITCADRQLGSQGGQGGSGTWKKEACPASRQDSPTTL